MFIFLCVITLNLTGCDNELISPGQSIVEVGERNKNILFSLRDLGALSPSQAESYAELINDNVQKYKEILEGSDDRHLDELKSAIVNILGDDPSQGLYGISNAGKCPADGQQYLTTGPDNSFEVEATEIKKWSSNFAQVEGGRGGEVKAYYESDGVASKVISPLIFIDKNNLSSLVKDINKEVYELNPQALQTENDFKILIDLLQKLKERKETGELKYTDFSQILPFFKKSNRTIFNYTADDIVLDTKSNSEALGEERPYNFTINKDVVITGFVKGKLHTEDKNGKCKIESGAKAVGVYTIRVQEFNASLVTELQEGAYTNNKYLSVSPQNENEVGIALLMEYPVEILDKLVVDTAGSNKWHFETKESDMLINLFNSEMRCKQADGSYKVVNNEEKEEERIYRVAGANATLQTTKGKNSSFRLAEGKDIKFVLTDYLELTYMPDVIENEDFIATGRRVSITDLKGEGDKTIGFFATKLGDKAEGGTVDIKVSDIVSFDSGQAPYFDKVAKVLSAVQTNSNEVQEELEKTEDEKIDSLYTLLSPFSDRTEDGMVSDKLKLQYKIGIDEIDPILKFTSSGSDTKPSLDSMDIDNDTVKNNALYGLCVNTHAYNTGLYTNWININSDGGENGSLRWWNSWLSSHGYNYNIDIGRLKSRMSGVYSTSLAKTDDKVIFDVDTLRVINEEMEADREKNSKSIIRTIEILVGGFLLVYGLILMGLWVLDVNMVNGPGFLTMATFGKFVAITDSREVPLMPGNGKIYVDFKALFTATFIFITVGILLILFDLQVLNGLIPRMLESLGNAFSDLLLNK